MINDEVYFAIVFQSAVAEKSVYQLILTLLLYYILDQHILQPFSKLY